MGNTAKIKHRRRRRALASKLRDARPRVPKNAGTDVPRDRDA